MTVPEPDSKPEGSTKKVPSPAEVAKEERSAVTDFLKSREGRATVNNVVRGAFALLKNR